MFSKFASRMTKILTVILTAMMLVTVVTSTVNAAGNTVGDVGQDIDDTKVVVLPLDVSKLETTIPTFSGDASTFVPGDGNGIEMELNKVYTATYNSALDYFGTPLTVKVDVQLINKDQMPADGGLCRIIVNGGGRVGVVWKLGYNVRVKWTITITDPETGKGYPAYFVMGFIDPDESNYYFDTAGKDIYYKDNEGKAIQYYIVKSDGICRIDEDGNELDPETYLKTPSDFNSAQFFSSLSSSDNGTFTFETATFANGGVFVPYIYSREYKVIYDLNDDDGPKATNPEENPEEYHTTGEEIKIEDPTRPGYKFTGWEDEEGNPKDTIDPWEEGDKTFVATWEKIEYKIEYRPNEDYAGGTGSVEGTMEDQKVTLGDNTLNDNQYSATGYKFVGWNTEPDGSGTAYNDPDNYPVTVADIEGKEDGATVGILYAQWEPIEYKIKYDPNGGEGEMDDDDHRKYDTTYNLSTHLYTREGYNWVGWNTEPDRDGTEYTENEEYINLTAEDGGVITMYAQWEPWKYYIDYDPNGGTGDMPMQTFTYEDDTMMSEKNRFTRDGYKFVGFVYTYNGNSKLITDPAEFREMLLSLGPESKITLVAQWEKIATQVVAIPVTGVE